MTNMKFMDKALWKLIVGLKNFIELTANDLCCSFHFHEKTWNKKIFFSIFPFSKLLLSIWASSLKFFFTSRTESLKSFANVAKDHWKIQINFEFLQAMFKVCMNIGKNYKEHEQNCTKVEPQIEFEE